MRTYTVADLFCGAGGSSTGAVLAIEALGGSVDLVAVNHWDVAVETHTRNHPRAQHYCVNLDQARPRDLVPLGHLDLLMASPECFPGDALVLTDRGPTPISDVSVGDAVLTHTGTWRPVTAVMRSTKPTVVVEGKGHSGLETTGEHPFYARRRYQRHRKTNDSRFRYGEPEWQPASRVGLKGSTWMWATPTRFGRLMVPKTPGGAQGLGFWFMVGRWLGDGSVCIDGKHTGTTVCCGHHEAEVLAGILDHTKPFAWKRREVRTATLFDNHDRELAEWLAAHFGQRAHGKTLPGWALTMPVEERSALLNGYLSADGHRAETYTSAFTVSRRLAVGIRLLAESLGHRASVLVRPQHNNVIEGRTVNARDGWLVRWSNSRTREHSVEIDGHSWRKVRRVLPGREAVEVFNLSVAVDESYVVDGIVVHNCTHFSRARGGKPTNDQMRMSAWHVVRWATELQIDAILVENVPEFQEWGPVDLADGKPIKAEKGRYFDAWVASLQAIGYRVEWTTLNAADYGDATTRVRFFLQAKRRGEITWPSASHSKDGRVAGTLRWRAAREVIDWSDRGTSLLERSKPLSLNTRLRIARGLQKYGGALAPYYIDLLDLPAAERQRFQIHLEDGRIQPFTIAQSSNAIAHDTGHPVPTISTIARVRLLNPEVTPFALAQGGGGEARPTDLPLPTIVGKGALSKVEPMILPYHRTAAVDSVDDPLSTVTTVERHGLVEPLIVQTDQTGGNGAYVQPIDAPLGTLTTKQNRILAQPMTVPYGPKAEARSVAEPIGTIPTKDRFALATPEAFITPNFGERVGQLPRVHGLEEPAPAVTSRGAGNLVAPDLAIPEAEAVVAIPEGDDPRRYVYIDGVLHRLDIHYRMLKNPELAEAMSFNAGGLYDFHGNNGEVTKQIGNAVPVRLARALVLAAFGVASASEIAS